MTKPERVLVSVDANTVIHFYRAGIFIEPGEVLEGVIDTFVCEEIQRNAPDVHRDFLDVGHMGSWLREVKPSGLDTCQKEIYNTSRINNKYMFDPKDEGEARAIALGHALGAAALLSDDTKKSGPRDYILKGAIGAIDTLAFWEVLLMLYLTRQCDVDGLKRLFEQVKQRGYDTLPKLDFKTVMIESVERLIKTSWFKKWLLDLEVKDLDQKIKVLKTL